MFLAALYIFITAQLTWGAPTSGSTKLSRGSSVPSVAASWYAGWHSGDYTLQDVSWSKYTHVIYAFA
jgi:chitinase